MWSVYTFLRAIKRYGSQPENRHFQCFDTVLTLARADTHAWIVYHGNKSCSNTLRLTFLVVYSFTDKQHRMRQNNDIYIASEMALVLLQTVAISFACLFFFYEKLEDIQMILQLSECLSATNICGQNMFPRMLFYVHATQQSIRQG